MRLIILLLVLQSAIAPLFCQKDTSNTTYDTAQIVFVSGNLTLTTIGFAPIPAFSFNGPMITAILSLKKGRFRFEPDFALDLSGQPWMANNWFRFSIREKRKWNLTAAINPFLVFETIKVGTDAPIIQVQRNISFEVSGEFKPTLRSTVILAYRFNKGSDGGLSGHLFDLSSMIAITSGSSEMSLILRPQLFYFDFKGSTNGLFTSAGLIIRKIGLPFSFQFQGVCLLKADFPADSFSWNLGLAYTF